MIILDVIIGMFSMFWTSVGFKHPFSCASYNITFLPQSGWLRPPWDTNHYS